MNTFEMKTAIHFGDNALDRLKEIPYKRVLIITDPFVVQSKMINLITAISHLSCLLILSFSSGKLLHHPRNQALPFRALILRPSALC